MKNYLLKQVYQALFYPFIFVAILWFVFYLQNTLDFNFSKLGVLPRELNGLPGILTSVFVHGDLGHIASNSIPLLVLGMMLFYFYKKIAKVTFIWIWLISGIWLWIGGRNSADYPLYHIGASTLIYGLATFLFFSGVFRRHLRLMVVSAMVVFLYGSIMWGIFPFKTEMSWEGHLFGAIAGVLVAFNYRKEGPQRREYVWPDENEEEDNQNPSTSEISEDLRNADNKTGNVTINFIYKEKKQSDQ